MEVTVKLLENAIQAALKEGRSGEGWTNGKGRFLVDGFPRKMDQALKFDEEVKIRKKYWPDCRLIFYQVCLSSVVIFFQTSEQVMLERLLKRAETSGREDDNVESIKKRFSRFCMCN